MKFRQAISCCKRIFEDAKPAFANKTRVYHFSETWLTRLLAINYSVPNKVKSDVPPVLNDPEVLFSASDKTKLFAEIFLKNSNLDESGISLRAPFQN